MVVYNYAGVSTNVLIGYEDTAYGTAATADKNIGFVQSLNMTDRNSLERVHAVGARNAQALVPKIYEVTGSVDVVYQNGRLLAYAVGTDEDAEVTDPDYSHTLAEADALSSFTLKASHDAAADLVRTYTGCVVNSIRLSGDMNSPLKMSADLLAQSLTVATSGAGTYTPDTTQVPAPQFGSFKIGAEAGEEAILQVQNFEFTLNNNIEMVGAVGNRLRRAAVPKTRTYDFRLSAALTTDSGASTQDSMEQLQILLGSTTPQSSLTEKSVIIEYDNGVAGGSGQRKLTADFDGFLYDEATVNTPVEGIVTIDLSGMAKSLDTVKIICIDDVATDYITAD